MDHITKGSSDVWYCVAGGVAVGAAAALAYKTFFTQPVTIGNHKGINLIIFETCVP